jgi:DmsE family decaheme c-type cytochrome
MTRARTTSAFAAFATLGLLFLLPPAARGEEGTGGNDSGCRDCHESLVDAFDRTAHRFGHFPKEGVTSARQVCESCHGDATKHIETNDPADIVRPKGKSGAGVCVSCHATSRSHAGFASGPHASAGVTCFDCHSVHGNDLTSGQLLRKRVGDLCASCHPTEAGSFKKPFSHRLGRGGMDCTSCHEPHGGRGNANLRSGEDGEGPCVTCHGDKRGPFVFEHPTGRGGDCNSCHEPHGSAQPKRLKRATVDALCLECHTPGTGTLGSLPPSIHNMLLPRYRNCTTCHPAIHGSNSSPRLMK